jgi:hypothetical protein
MQGGILASANIRFQARRKHTKIQRAILANRNECGKPYRYEVLVRHSLTDSAFPLHPSRVFKCVVRDIGGKMTMKVQFATVVAAMMVLSGTVIAAEKPLKPLPKDCSRQFLEAWDHFISAPIESVKPEDAPKPKEPCTMRGRGTGIYICDQDGCMKHREGYREQ